MMQKQSHSKICYTVFVLCLWVLPSCADSTFQIKSVDGFGDALRQLHQRLLQEPDFHARIRLLNRFRRNLGRLQSALEKECGSIDRDTIRNCPRQKRDLLFTLEDFNTYIDMVLPAEAFPESEIPDIVDRIVGYCAPTKQYPMLWDLSKNGREILALLAALCHRPDLAWLPRNEEDLRRRYPDCQGSEDGQ